MQTLYRGRCDSILVNDRNVPVAYTVRPEARMEVLSRRIQVLTAAQSVVYVLNVDLSVRSLMEALKSALAGVY